METPSVSVMNGCTKTEMQVEEKTSDQEIVEIYQYPGVVAVAPVEECSRIDFLYTPLGNFFLPVYTSPTNSDNDLSAGQTNIWFQSSPRVDIELQLQTSDSDSSVCEKCVMCNGPANTCVMHFAHAPAERHLTFCYSCACACVENHSTCPLCPERILYIYMYDLD